MPMNTDSKLKGLNVVFFESRLAKTMSDLINLQGGNAFSAPSMKEVSLENNTAVFSFADKLFKKKVGLLILLTGVGARSLMAVLETKYPRKKILDALKRTVIVPRGPKPVRVLNEWAVPFALTVPEPNTWREILQILDQNRKKIPLKERQVFVQEYGARNNELLEGLKIRGAYVTPVPVYRWELPDDLGPLKNAVCQIVEGKMDVAIFTTAVQAEHLLKVARFIGVELKLKNALQQMVIASVGPDCTKTLSSFGISVDIQPESPKMGPLVTETSQRASGILEMKRSREYTSEVSKPIPLIAEDETKPEGHAYHESAFLKASCLEKTSYTPIWLMRQAGRYMKEYRRIRDAKPFLDICKDKDLVTEITVVAQEKIKADAAIIFSDILLLAESFGLGLEYLKGDGPSIKRPIRSASDVSDLPEADVRNSLSFVFQAIRQTRDALNGSIPLIGFAGAPFTLASYMIEGGSSKDFQLTKEFMLKEPKAWKALMEKISIATAQYLNQQIEAGVQAVQVFDSWAGHLSEFEYRKFAMPYSSKLIEDVKKGVPVIHFGTGTSRFLKSFSLAGGDVISVDHQIGLDKAWKIIGKKKAIQGNLDPSILLSNLKDIKKHVKVILDSVKGRPGHIFNLGHGVLPDTPVENVIALVDMVHEMSTRQNR